MADLKTLDAKKITERFADKADEFQHDLQRAARNAIDEVRLVAATLKELPPSSSELLTQAVVARTMEIDVKLAELSIGGEPREPPTVGQVRISNLARGWGDYVMDGKDVIAPGKYRALFFLVPVKR